MEGNGVVGTIIVLVVVAFVLIKWGESWLQFIGYAAALVAIILMLDAAFGIQTFIDTILNGLGAIGDRLGELNDGRRGG